MTADNKITISDLKITPPCWQWMAKKTRTWSFIICDDGSGEYIQSVESNSKIFFEDFDGQYLCRNPSHQENLESFIYQAIDGICLKSDVFITQSNPFIRVTYYDTDRFFKYFLYDCCTTARLAALQWIWQQEQKQEAANNGS